MTSSLSEWPQAGEEIGERTVAQEKETEGATKDAHHFSELGTQHFSQSLEMMLNFPILRNDILNLSVLRNDYYVKVVASSLSKK